MYLYWVKKVAWCARRKCSPFGDGSEKVMLEALLSSTQPGSKSWCNLRYMILMRMNLQDIYQERELVLVVIKVRLILLRMKLGLAS